MFSKWIVRYNMKILNPKVKNLFNYKNLLKIQDMQRRGIWEKMKNIDMTI